MSQHDGESIDFYSTRVISLAFIIMIIGAGVFAFIFSIDKLPLFSDQGSIDIENKINPNTATAASLARLPNIGSTRANAIILYRENSGSEHPFNDAKDLKNVEGIGETIAQQLSEYLVFE